MNKKKLFLFSRMGLARQEKSENQKAPIRFSISSSVETKIIDKCAGSFIESIVLGELYQELKPREINSKEKIIRI